jgi:hypothetical protein
MTNDLGSGTLNRTVNLLIEEDEILSREAFNGNKSRGELIRELLLEGAKKINPRLAVEIARVRAVGAITIKASKPVAKAATGIALSLLMLVAASDRRTVRRVGLRRNEIEFAGVEI